VLSHRSDAPRRQAGVGLTQGPFNTACTFANNPPLGSRCPVSHRHSTEELTPSLVAISVRRHLRDRIDLIVDLPAVTVQAITDTQPGESTAVVRARVCAARSAQQARYSGRHARTNADLRGAGVAQFCAPDANGRGLLRVAIERLGLSARGSDRVLKVARTIADLAGSTDVRADHVAQYRLIE